MYQKTIGYFSLPLSPINQWLASLIAFFLVAFGQPAWIPLNGLLAGAFGFALFWRVLLAYPFAKQRFCIATLWFFTVQLVQLSWFISHPYWYIYAVYLFLSLAIGVQFGLIAILIAPEKFKQSQFLKALVNFLQISSLWTIFEWSRLFLLSGCSWNPIGIALTSNLYALQTASLAGVFGISFWIILTNSLALWAWVQKKFFPINLWILAALLPYLFGALQFTIHDQPSQKTTRNLTALLIQTAFSPEESEDHSKKKNLVELVIHEWRQILQIIEKHKEQTIDLIVLPEFVVPFGTYSDVYPLIHVKKAFLEILGPESLSSLPILEHPFVSFQETQEGPQWLVNNAYWTQTLANYFNADVIIGLEDAEDIAGTREYYNSAIFIHPQGLNPSSSFFAERYSKRILVPLGEYIPFEACRELARNYGVFGSFTSGKEAIIMRSNGVPFSPSICYEETFGNIMREGKQKGADLFINLTSDVWYPNSKLPQQHLDHARLRTVENGIPLMRACNTGITAVIDSLGRNIAILGGDRPEQVEWIPDSLLVNVPIYSYQTPYSQFGDLFIIGVSFFLILVSLTAWFQIRK